ncbi:MAG: hypothetical protein L7A77_10845, partial [Xylella fastidiosa subsp. multiplex]|nr:hypothetical protein [Xylella fastidiosa subsp. multiplex]
FWTCTPCEQEPETKAWAFEFGTGITALQHREQCRIPSALSVARCVLTPLLHQRQVRNDRTHSLYRHKLHPDISATPHKRLRVSSAAAASGITK